MLKLFGIVTKEEVSSWCDDLIDFLYHLVKGEMLIITADVYHAIVRFTDTIMIVGWVGDDEVEFLLKVMGQEVIMIGGSL